MHLARGWGIPPPPPYSKFYSRLLFEDVGGYPYPLVKPLIYFSALLHAYIVVPRHFSTDLASIPWFAQPLFGFRQTGHYDRATVIHDYLYSIQTHPRHLCDAILLEAMAVDGVNWHRWLIWAGVRIGGWWAWHNDGKLFHNS